MSNDIARIIIRSGKGGNGHVSFRREKYVPDGGPDGGDGGKGGDVIFLVDSGVNTLIDFRHRRKFSAGDGEEGSKKRMHGKNGADLILKVPEGTVIRDAKSGMVIKDMSGSCRKYTILRGGAGGHGNMHFATSTMQAPKYAKPGGEAKEIEIILELKLIADVGLVGFPNVGKSTFLSMVSNAEPKIANYHFTTLEPVLGVVTYPGVPEFVIADIPGLIEGASTGIGLGHEFLRHIERTRVLIHMVDGASLEGRDPVSDINVINSELLRYDKKLTEKPQIIALNKMDACEDKDAVVKRVETEFAGRNFKVMTLSAAENKGIKEVLFASYELLKSLPKETEYFESETEPVNEDEKTESISVYKNSDGSYTVEGPKIDKMLGYTHLESEKGFAFFQRFLKEQGINKRLEDLGIRDGDTVILGGESFEYYSS